MWNAGKVDTYTITLIRAEMNQEPEMVLDTINDIRNIAQYIESREDGKTIKQLKKEILDMGYDPSLYKVAKTGYVGEIDYELAVKFSERFATEAFKYILDTMKDPDYVSEIGRYDIYLLDSEIIDTFVDKYSDMIGYIYYDDSDREVGKHPSDLYGCGLAMLEPLKHLTQKAREFQDLDLYFEYFGEYFNYIPEDYIRKVIVLTDKDYFDIYEIAEGYK